jgi:FkbM family methyltransferase
MQRLYILVRGDGKTLTLEVNGVEGVFSAETTPELRCVEGTLLSEREFLSAIQTILKPGDVFLDVGSNLGVFTIFGAKAVGPHGKVVACEPRKITFERAQKNAQLNQLHNIIYLRLALSDTRSTKKLVLDDDEPFGLRAHLADSGGLFCEDVQAVDYDSLVEDEGLPIPRVVKMDVEGHEYAALKGMKRTLSNSACTVLYCEIHPHLLPPDVSAGDVQVLIQSYGFEYVSTRMRGRVRQVTAVKHAAREVVGYANHGDAC